MARHGKQRRAKRKRQEREHEQWARERSDDYLDPKGGQFYVLLWPNMEKVKGLNWNQAEEIWRNHTDRAMIFSMNDLGSGNG